MNNSEVDQGTNSHLHDFRIAGGCYGLPDGEWPNDALLDERRFTIGQPLAAGMKQFKCSYDLGDAWEKRAATLQPKGALRHRPTRTAQYSDEDPTQAW